MNYKKTILAFIIENTFKYVNFYFNKIIRLTFFKNKKIERLKMKPYDDGNSTHKQSLMTLIIYADVFKCE